MSDVTVQIHIPSTLLQFGLNQAEIQRRIGEWVVLSLFTEGHVSSGKAARLLNLSRVEFLALLRSRGIAYLNYSPDELDEEFAAANKLELGRSE